MMDSRKIVIFIGLFIFLIFLIILNFFLPQPANVVISVSNINVIQGQNFDLNVSIDPLGLPISGVQMDIIYNSSLIKINSIKEGNLFTQNGAISYFNGGIVNNSTGTAVNIFSFISGQNSTYTLGTFIVLNMTAMSMEGASRINLTNVIIKDPVKVAVLYERVTDGALYGRSNDDIIKLLKQTRTDFIFRGFWRWEPVPESRKSAPEEVSKLGGTQDELQAVLDYNYTYEDLKVAISGIKREMPNVIFVGAIPAQRINGIDKDDVTGEILDTNKTWEMALDPQKWGIGVSKKDYQKMLGDTLGWREGEAYFPDITNSNYQQFLLDMAKKQIDCGADAIWIDMLPTQAVLLDRYSKYPKNPGIKESMEASSNIVDEIHKYGKSKGKTILVGTGAGSIDLSYPQPKLDFVTLSPKTSEVASKTLNKSYWDDRKNKIIEKLGNIKIYVFIDWANNDSPIVTFSQNLSKSEQGIFIRDAYNFFEEEGMIFILPVHGGFMGNQASILSFGNSKVYDSMAPQFGTFETIENISNSNFIPLKVQNATIIVTKTTSKV